MWLWRLWGWASSLVSRSESIYTPFDCLRCLRAPVSWLHVCTYERDILQSNKMLHSRHNGRRDKSFFLSWCWFVFSHYSDKWNITLCEPPCFQTINGVSHLIKQKGKKNSEMLCRTHFVRFQLICLFMWTGTPWQRNNDISLQVVCRISLDFEGAWMVKFPKGWHLCGGGFDASVITSAQGLECYRQHLKVLL